MHNTALYDIVSIDFYAGTSIHNAAHTAIALAKTQERTVLFVFNEVTLTATSHETPERTVARYQEAQHAVAEAYRASPAYAAAQREAAARETRQQEHLAEALRTAPATMTLADPEVWARYRTKNHDAYGAACLAYAERWARLMESRMQAGETLRRARTRQATSQTQKASPALCMDARWQPSRHAGSMGTSCGGAQSPDPDPGGRRPGKYHGRHP